MPTQDHEKTSPSPQIDVSPLGSPHQLLSPLTKNRAQHGNNRRRAPSPHRLRAAGAGSASPKLSDDSEEEVLNDKTKPTKKKGSSLTYETKQAFDKRSPMIPKEKVEDVLEDANIRVFTEKDFDSLKFDFTRTKSTEPCLLKVKLSTYGIGSISMEYNWNKKGT